MKPAKTWIGYQAGLRGQTVSDLGFGAMGIA